MSRGLDLIDTALKRGRAQHGPIVSVHEAVAVIREEYLEMEREAFTRHVDRDALCKELSHLGAMCARAIEDLDLARSPLAALVES